MYLASQKSLEPKSVGILANNEPHICLNQYRLYAKHARPVVTLKWDGVVADMTASYCSGPSVSTLDP